MRPCGTLGAAAALRTRLGLWLRPRRFVAGLRTGRFGTRLLNLRLWAGLHARLLRPCLWRHARLLHARLWLDARLLLNTTLHARLWLHARLFRPQLRSRRFPVTIHLRLRRQSPLFALSHVGSTRDVTRIDLSLDAILRPKCFHLALLHTIALRTRSIDRGAVATFGRSSTA